MGFGGCLFCGFVNARGLVVSSVRVLVGLGGLLLDLCFPGCCDFCGLV